jgi:hypothetical protein
VPERLYRFVDVVSFTDDWADLQLSDDELRSLSAWPKSEREDLAPADYNAIGKAVAHIRELLDAGRIL